MFSMVEKRYSMTLSYGCSGPQKHCGKLGMLGVFG